MQCVLLLVAMLKLLFQFDVAADLSSGQNPDAVGVRCAQLMSLRCAELKRLCSLCCAVWCMIRCEEHPVSLLW